MSSTSEIDRTSWNLDVLRRMDWRSLELLCAEIFREVGYEVEDTGRGADGGIDLICRNPAIEFAVQCKRYKGAIPMKEVRELYGSMARREIRKGVFVTTGIFNNRAREEFGRDEALELVDGESVLQGIGEFSDETRAAWLAEFAASDNWDVPTCPSCDIKMVVRNNSFWGCPNFGPSKCRQTFQPHAFPLPEA